MRRQIIILSVLCVLYIPYSSAQIVRVPPCNYWCQLFGGQRTPWLRLKPADTRFYSLPRGVGVVQGGNFEINPENPDVTQHFTLSELFDDIVGHGIKVASVHTKTIPWLTGEAPPCDDPPGPPPQWPIGDPAFGNDALDVLIVWPMSLAWAYEEAGCDGVVRTVLSEYPTADWAEFLYSNYGHQDRVIILSDWELDHGLRGIGCDCDQEMSHERRLYITQLMSERQREVVEVRARYPDAKLRVMYGPQVNRFPCNNICPEALTVTEIIAELPVGDQPDLILLSYWCNDNALVDTLDWVQETTGYAENRLVVSELGRPQQNGQYEYITQQATAALQWGVNVVTVWQWRQTWCGDNGRGMWLISQPCDGRVTWGDPAPGYYAIQELNEEYRHD